MEIAPNPFPDNIFFEAADGHPRGGSWNGEVDGMRATYGAIEPGTVVTYGIDGREVIFVESGSASVSFEGEDGQPIKATYKPGDLFELPLGKPFTLSTLGDEKFVYGCLYPDQQ